MESALGVERAQGPEWEDAEGEISPAVVKVDVGGEEWLKELERVRLGR